MSDNLAHSVVGKAPKTLETCQESAWETIDSSGSLSGEATRSGRSVCNRAQLADVLTYRHCCILYLCVFFHDEMGGMIGCFTRIGHGDKHGHYRWDRIGLV
jgi:hypothetical protein